MRCTCPACAREFEVVATEDAGRIHCIHCGQEFHPAATFRTSFAPGKGEREMLAPGTRLGQFLIEEVLGAGGACVVYRATQPSLKRSVALKVLPRSLSDDPQFVKRFRREARAMAELTHPGIVAIYDRGEESGRLFLAMELVEGTTLRGYVEARRDRPTEWLPLLLPVCEALEHAHSRGFVHRDIKPENILVDRQGRPKIADFGLVRLIKGYSPEPGGVVAGSKGTTFDSATDAATPVGTLKYASPEQRKDPTNVDEQTDLYSLGVVMYELLTGAFPDEHGMAPPSTLAQVDPRVDPIVLRLIEIRPGFRCHSATQLKGILAPFLGVMLPREEYDARERARERRLRRIRAASRGIRVAVAIGSALIGIACVAAAGASPERWRVPIGGPGWIGALLIAVSVPFIRSLLPKRSRQASLEEADRRRSVATALCFAPALAGVLPLLASLIPDFLAEMPDLHARLWYLPLTLVSWSGVLLSSSEVRPDHPWSREVTLLLDLLTLAFLAGGWALLGSGNRPVALNFAVLVAYPFAAELVLWAAEPPRRR